MSPSLAEILEVAPEELDAVVARAERLYACFELGGSRKRRRIEAPREPLRTLQRRLLDRLLYTLKPTASAHGFVRGRSILTHARRHEGRPFVLKADLARFFPSISADRVRRALSELPLDQADLARAVALTTRRGRLPQGAPTSPHIANLVTRDLDAKLAAVARARRWRYSRYADDLAFSGARDGRPLLVAVERAVREAGFRLRQSKTRLMGQNRRQQVTGLVVNRRAALPRPLRRRLRAVLHRVALNGWDALRDFEPEEVLGHLAFYGFIMPRQCRALIQRLARLAGAGGAGADDD